MEQRGVKESAGAGKIFVLTNLGYEKTPNNIKSERAIGKPVKGFEYSVPASWLNKGYIEEIEEDFMKKCPYEENKRCTKDCKHALTCIQRKPKRERSR